jgi:hypothetical protein
MATFLYELHGLIEIVQAKAKEKVLSRSNTIVHIAGLPDWKLITLRGMQLIVDESLKTM